MSQNYTPTTRLTYKDIQTLLGNVSHRTAQQYLKDIKDSCKTKVVLYAHFVLYFNL